MELITPLLIPAALGHILFFLLQLSLMGAVKHCSHMALLVLQAKLDFALTLRELL